MKCFFVWKMEVLQRTSSPLLLGTYSLSQGAWHYWAIWLQLSPSRNIDFKIFVLSRWNIFSQINDKAFLVCNWLFAFAEQDWIKYIMMILETPVDCAKLSAGHVEINIYINFNILFERMNEMLIIDCLFMYFVFWLWCDMTVLNTVNTKQKGGITNENENYFFLHHFAVQTWGVDTHREDGVTPGLCEHAPCYGQGRLLAGVVWLGHRRPRQQVEVSGHPGHRHQRHALGKWQCHHNNMSMSSQQHVNVITTTWQ